MPTYRCFLKGDDGRITGVEDIDAPQDEDAKRRCLEFLKVNARYRGVELWLLHRLIHRHP